MCLDGVMTAKPPVSPELRVAANAFVLVACCSVAYSHPLAAVRL